MSKKLNQAIDNQEEYLKKNANLCREMSGYFDLLLQSNADLIIDVDRNDVERIRGRMALLRDLKETFEPGGQ